MNRKKIMFFLMFAVVMLMIAFPVQSASDGDPEGKRVYD
jgi:hypothetical protein